MFQVVLIHPEIPPNTGNVIRLCANTGAQLHLVEPLGFELSEYRLRRAGMDYAELASVQIHSDWAACKAVLGSAARRFAMTTKGACRAAIRNGAESVLCSTALLRSSFISADFLANDVFVFGCETKGLPVDILAEFTDEFRIRLPMVPGNRSINLSNAVAVTVFEAWRQQGYAGGE